MKRHEAESTAACLANLLRKTFYIVDVGTKARSNYHYTSRPHELVVETIRPTGEGVKSCLRCAAVGRCYAIHSYEVNTGRSLQQCASQT